MASLLDPLPEEMLHLLRVVADGYAIAGGRWPCWQWVRQQLWARYGLDAQEILDGIPTWEHDYRPVRLGYRGQPVPKIAAEVPLSLHGMAFVAPAVPAVQHLVKAFPVTPASTGRAAVCTRPTCSRAPSSGLPDSTT